jgi:predicted CDP-diglyceride synthetase/phosphatidate cytidylyltransferase
VTAHALPAFALLALAAIAAVVLLAPRVPEDAATATAEPWRRRLATPAVLAALLASTWAGPLAVACTLAVLSAWMLHGMLALDVPRTATDRVPRLACFACVPLQFGLVATGAGGASVVLPLVAALALPAVTVVAGDLPALGDRLAARFQAVMLSVYALSFAAMPVASGRGAALVVVAAVAGSIAFDAQHAFMRRRTPHHSPRLRLLVALAVSMLATGAGGATVAPLVAQPAAGTALVAAVAALCGGLGTLVMDSMARSARGVPARCGVPARLEAVAFAAPLVWALGL